jgi:hypothetical protein
MGLDKSCGMESTGMTKSQLAAYREGYLYALWQFAWHKDGDTYVGSCGKTYRQAKAEFEDQYQEQLKTCVVA